jgi:peptide/nickel transport system ATP-binding protein
MTNTNSVLDVLNLKTHFFLEEGTVRSVDDVSFSVERGKTLCVVGESGCGKSVSARSILQLIDPPGRIVDGEILLHRRGEKRNEQETVDIAKLDPRGKEIRRIRGKEISMIFQEPMTSLSPVHTIGDQIGENVQLHLQMDKTSGRARAIEALRLVGIPRPEVRVDAYPFQLSGGMRQRAMIAMALSCRPDVLIADEPTTALDVTTQAQILSLMKSLQDEIGMGMLFITHDLGVVAEIADDVVVMYLGTVVERGSVDEIFHDPKHPYTRALLRSIPRLDVAPRDRLGSIQGIVPNPFNRPPGCPFNTRCEYMMPGNCDTIEPPPIAVGSNRDTRCLLYDEAIVGNQSVQEITE